MNLSQILLLLFFVSAGSPALAQTPMASYAKAGLALEAAMAGYQLPNLRARVSERDFLANFAQFSRATPEGYQVYGADADLLSGLKFVIYKPVNADSEGPWILSLTGTETLVDWVTNTDLGRPQLLGLKKIVTLFTTNFVPDRELIITGHSLGGALAQAAAHEIQRERTERGLVRKKITLITWNAFGAQELINKFGKYKPELSEQFEIANYYVRGDVVSQIGRHFGPTYELIPPAQTGGKIATALHLHSMALIKEVFSPLAMSTARNVSPPFAKSLNLISEVSGVVALLGGQIHEFRQLWLVRWLYSILEKVETPEQLHAHVDAYTYLYNVGYTEQIRLYAEKHPDKARDYVRLKKTLERFLQLKSGQPQVR